MRKYLKTLLSTAAIVAALAGGSAFSAYAEPQTHEGSDGIMQGGQSDMMDQSATNMMSSHNGMMGMMKQMSQMMETCNGMMQKMAAHHGQETPKVGQTPGKEG